MTEALHRDLQPLRGNAFEVIGRLREARVFFALNHLLHFYRGQIPLDRYLRLLSEVPALEVRNGTMVPSHNLLVEAIVQQMGRLFPFARPAITAGSDAHTLRRIGRTWTEAPAGSRDEFLEAITRGLGRAAGVHGGANAVAGDAYGVIRAYYASLLGFGPADHAPLHRAGCLAFSFSALPGQFLPWLIPAMGKWRERTKSTAVAEALAPWLDGRTTQVSWLGVREERA